MSISKRLEALTVELRDLVPTVPPGAWQKLRLLANEAEELAQEAARVENLEASFIDGAREAGHGHQIHGATV